VAFQGFQRYSFTLSSIRRNAPSSPGVYGISNADEWIFVGSGDDLRAALLAHLTSAGTSLLSRAPTGFAFETCTPGALSARLTRLVVELKPTCNRR
jgi:hypothetical protein